MNDYSCPAFPSTEEFLGPGRVRPGDEPTGGYAKKIIDLAIEVHGNKELGYIPLDSPVNWAAGKLEAEVRAAPDLSEAERDIVRNEGPYVLDENGRYQGTSAQWEALYAHFEWVGEWWSEILGPDPDGFDSSIQDLANAADTLYSQSTGIESAGPAWQSANTALGNWESDASRSFQENVWTRLPNIIRRQSSAIGGVFHSVTAERRLWLEHRKSLKSIAENTIVALEAIKEDAEADPPPADLTVLQGLATVAATALAFPTGGASLAALGAGITIASGLAAVGQGLVSEQPDPPSRAEQVPLGAPTVSEVLTNMQWAGGNCSSDVTIGEQEICDGLINIYDRLTDNSSLEGEGDIPEEELPEGARPGDYGERTYTPREKFMIPRPPLIEQTSSIPEPPVPT